MTAMTGEALPNDYEPDVVRALVIAVDGTWRVVETRTGLDSYQRLVGGWLTVYYPTKDWHLYAHEATSMDEPTNVPENKAATELAHWGDPHFGRTILGTAVIVGTGPTGQDLSVPADVLRHLKGEL